MKPTIVDIYKLRLMQPIRNLPFPPAKHMIQCAKLAMTAGADETIVLACLLHDIGFAIMRPDHGWWGAQLVEPYVPEKVTWAIRYHQALLRGRIGGLRLSRNVCTDVRAGLPPARIHRVRLPIRA
jgi:predicted HD phosphohydrolase